jgi:biotin operon repressor
MNLEEDFVSQATAARMLGITRAAVADLIKRGRLRTKKIAGRPHLYKSDVINFQPQKPGPKPGTGAQRQARK